MFVRRYQGLTIFCSDLAPLFAAARSRCTLDAEAALWYLAFGMPPPGRTMAAGVDRVPAAHALSFEAGNPPVAIRYWTPLTAEAPATPTIASSRRCGRRPTRRLPAPCPKTGKPGCCFPGVLTRLTWLLPR